MSYPNTLEINTFYQFTPSALDVDSLSIQLRERCRASALLGTILLADEGINGTIAGQPSDMSAFRSLLREQPMLTDIRFRVSHSPKRPFRNLKVKIKPSLVNLGCTEAIPQHRTGAHIRPEQWDAVTQQAHCLLIDTRNRYETAIGSFSGATCPGTENFHEFSEYVEQLSTRDKALPVAMFCTGGIRCEKASALMLARGFKQVYQLEGGILNYLESIPESRSTWHGDCFVFDDRIAVNHGLQPAGYVLCDFCAAVVSPDMQTSPYYEPGVSCPQCYEMA